MVRLNVNPTKMILTSLKKRLLISRRGHKMLKDKRDEMMKQFIIIFQEAKILRGKVESQIIESSQNFGVLLTEMDDFAREDFIEGVNRKTEILLKSHTVMSVQLPKFELVNPIDIGNYSLLSTPGEMDKALMSLSDLGSELIKLAELEKGLECLALELEKVRRRVNALEFVTIPQFEETIRYITMKLDENERGSRTRLIKLKDMVFKQKEKLISKR